MFLKNRQELKYFASIKYFMYSGCQLVEGHVQINNSVHTSLSVEIAA